MIIKIKKIIKDGNVVQNTDPVRKDTVVVNMVGVKVVADWSMIESCQSKYSNCQWFENQKKRKKK